MHGHAARSFCLKHVAVKGMQLLQALCGTAAMLQALHPEGALRSLQSAVDVAMGMDRGTYCERLSLHFANEHCQPQRVRLTAGVFCAATCLLLLSPLMQVPGHRAAIEAHGPCPAHMSPSSH